MLANIEFLTDCGCLEGSFELTTFVGLRLERLFVPEPLELKFTFEVCSSVWIFQQNLFKVAPVETDPQ